MPQHPDDQYCACGCGYYHEEHIYRVRDGKVYFFCLGDDNDNLLEHVERWEKKHLNGHKFG